MLQTRLLPTFAALFALFVSALAQAQISAAGQDKQVSSGDSAEDESTSIQEITVTAQRREESVDKVPISITALSQQAMDDLHIVSVSDLATVVPGVNISPPATFQDHSEIAIRGIYSLGNAPTTQLYIDETPIAIRELAVAFSKSPFPNIFDLDRVEVLRGPQGTLFGTSAMGGAIRFVTPQPSLTEESGFAKADVGYTQDGAPNYEVGAAYGAPVANGVAGFRVSAWAQDLGGFIDREDPYTGAIIERNINTSQSYVIRPAFSVVPLDNLKITASLFLQHQFNPNGNSYWVTDLPNTEDDSHILGGTDQSMTDNLRVSSLSIKYNFANVAFDSDTSYLDRSSDTHEDTTHLWQTIFGGAPFITGIPQSFAAYEQNHSATTAWQQEFRFSSRGEDSRINWVGGAVL